MSLLHRPSHGGESTICMKGILSQIRSRERIVYRFYTSLKLLSLSLSAVIIKMLLLFYLQGEMRPQSFILSYCVAVTLSTRLPNLSL